MTARAWTIAVAIIVAAAGWGAAAEPDEVYEVRVQVPRAQHAAVRSLVTPSGRAPANASDVVGRIEARRIPELLMQPGVSAISLPMPQNEVFVINHPCERGAWIENEYMIPIGRQKFELDEFEKHGIKVARSLGFDDRLVATIPPQALASIIRDPRVRALQPRCLVRPRACAPGERAFSDVTIVRYHTVKGPEIAKQLRDLLVAEYSIEGSSFNRGAVYGRVSEKQLEAMSRDERVSSIERDCMPRRPHLVPRSAGCTGKEGFAVSIAETLPDVPAFIEEMKSRGVRLRLYFPDDEVVGVGHLFMEPKHYSTKAQRVLLADPRVKEISPECPDELLSSPRAL